MSSQPALSSGLKLQKIVDEMLIVAPSGQKDVDYSTREQLAQLTALLMEVDDTALGEYGRFLEVRDRRMDLGPLRADMSKIYDGRRILVTGGTGCIGSTLIRELVGHSPTSSIYCIYSGDNAFDPVPGVVYVDVDIVDEAELMEAVRQIKPQVIFHCAAQRSPMLAEHEVARTVLTNVIGTRNVLRAAREVNVERFIHTSTGKAMRYYTTDIYAASKKVAEWLVQSYAAEGRPTGLARFTHVVDNAVVIQTIESEMADQHGLVRCHGADIEFYVQSAAESAQLLMIAGVVAQPRTQAVAIRCLGEPVRLLSLMLGKMLSTRTGRMTPIYLSGYDKGYERGNPPGLYDPITAADLSPLINAIEAASAGPVPLVPEVDQFFLSLPSGGLVNTIVNQLEWVCRHEDPMTVATELANAVKVEAEAMFGMCPAPLFARLHKMATRAGVALPTQREVG